MITVYAYNATTKEYIGTTQAQVSPLEKDVILMPANSTAIQPPQIAEKQTAVWNSSGWWDVVADLRGTVYYDADGKEYTQNQLGELPDGALLEKPVIQEEEPERQLGELTLGYITKLNTLYPTLNLLATDSIEEATVKLTAAGVDYNDVGTLITFYDKGW